MIATLELTKCRCPGHRFPGVKHFVACCDKPHVEWTKEFRARSLEKETYN